MFIIEHAVSTPALYLLMVILEIMKGVNEMFVPNKQLSLFDTVHISFLTFLHARVTYFRY